MNQHGSRAVYHQAILCQNSSVCRVPAVWASYLNFQKLNLLVYKIELITFTAQEICVSFVIAPQSTQIMASVHDKYLVNVEKA